VAGAKFCAEIKGKIEKWQEPPPPPKPKPLAAPDDGVKKKRGGRKVRKMKNKMMMTEVRTAANRLKFGEAVEDDFSRDGETFGMLSQANSGSGHIRQPKGGDIQRKTIVNAAKRKFLSGKQSVGGTQTGLKSGGMATSLAFTPVQGLELANPALEREKKRKLEEINKSYFSSSLAGFNGK
jgi:U4/U6 small nuclear ribonucleoprotein PRP31